MYQLLTFAFLRKLLGLKCFNTLYFRELLVEPPQRMLCNHIPNSLMSGTDHEGKVFQPYQPMMSQREFRLFQPGDLATSKR